MQLLTRGFVCTDEGNIYAFSVEDVPKFTLLQDSAIMSSVSALEALPGGGVCCAGTMTSTSLPPPPPPHPVPLLAPAIAMPHLVIYIALLDIAR